MMECYSDVRDGTRFTRKFPGEVDNENCSTASSAAETNGSRPSLTSYPYAMRRIIAPAVLNDSKPDLFFHFSFMPDNVPSNVGR